MCSRLKKKNKLYTRNTSIITPRLEQYTYIYTYVTFKSDLKTLKKFSFKKKLCKEVDKFESNSYNSRQVL